ncbi:MAG: hypothetical protein RLZZ538_1330 [Actinomycetota bacterium]
MLRFTTRPLAEFTDAPCDLNDVASNDGVLFVRNGVGFAGRGIAMRGTSAEVQGAMLDAEFDDSVNSRAVRVQRSGGIHSPVTRAN